MSDMKRKIFTVFACVLMLSAVMTLTACADETEDLQARIDLLEAENRDMQSTITYLESDLQTANANLTTARNDLALLVADIEAAQEAEEEAQQQQETSGAPVGPLAITYGGVPNPDMSWPLAYGDLPLGLRMDFDLGEDYEIVWTSANVNIFTVAANEDGTRATVTPIVTGSAQVIVTVNGQETRSWVRITG